MNELNEAIARFISGQFPKVCACCARAFDVEAWSNLRLIGHQEDAVERLELRDCHCGSTLAVVSNVRDAVAKVREIVRAKFGGVR